MESIDRAAEDVHNEKKAKSVSRDCCGGFYHILHDIYMMDHGIIRLECDRTHLRGIAKCCR